ncbi:MAG: helix-turn-helix domain-containing protein [Candidatus Hydrogenedens sp.]|nr:helix-turn-helix domain-containing protein [Candidatus Hydrogenedentota bacterium]NLF56555.1 helix-turn-helix domain-containing protein [Candidatus Hydrogenedens sp.]
MITQESLDVKRKIVYFAWAEAGCYPVRTMDKNGTEGFSERLAELIGSEPVATFAKRCGVPESNIRTYLQGKRPRVDRLVLIADGAGVSLEWLATGRGDKFGEAPVLGSLQGRGNVLLKAIGGLEDEAEKAALLDEFQARVQKEKQFSDMKRQLGRGGRRKKIV